MLWIILISSYLPAEYIILKTEDLGTFGTPIVRQHLKCSGIWNLDSGAYIHLYGLILYLCESCHYDTRSWQDIMTWFQLGKILGINQYKGFARSVQKSSSTSKINIAEIAEINNRGRVLGMLNLKGFRFWFSSCQHQVYFFAALLKRHWGDGDYRWLVRIGSMEINHL